MGRRGPNKSDFSIVKGTSKKRKGEPEPPAITVDQARPPVPLLAAERRIFNETCQRVASMRALSDADLPAICFYAQVLAEMNKIRKTLRRYEAAGKKSGESDSFGQWKRNAEGGKYWVKHPERTRLKELELRFLQISKELYLTPAARSGGKVTAAPAAGPAGMDPDRAKLYGG